MERSAQNEEDTGSGAQLRRGIVASSVASCKPHDNIKKGLGAAGMRLRRV